jgi:drug/metabolite transporter (DMT)-like permease
LMVYQGMSFDWDIITPFFWLLITIGGISSLIFFWLWPWGLKYVSATKASLYGGLMPISTVILAYIFLGEALHPLEGLGMVLILISLWFGSHQGNEFIKRIWNVRTRA